MHERASTSPIARMVSSKCAKAGATALRVPPEPMRRNNSLADEGKPWDHLEDDLGDDLGDRERKRSLLATWSPSCMSQTLFPIIKDHNCTDKREKEDERLSGGVQRPPTVMGGQQVVSKACKECLGKKLL